jgi:hypothetical protein
MNYVEPFSKSETIALVGYDESTEVMEVQFRTRTGVLSYLYSLVPKSVAEGLVKAESPGAFFHGNVKGRYLFQKLPTPKAE